ncbi:MAG: ferrous iron transport protein A [Spirochaetia bacterium]|nr:ferrous iron transport protein A [Spirochaetia bacterium]
MRGFGQGMFGRGRGGGRGRGHGPKGCSDGECCARRRRALHGMTPGESAIITELPCQGKHRKRLISLGMLPGTRVTCVRTNGKSGLCVRIDRSEFCIDSSLAEQIQVGGSI